MYDFASELSWDSDHNVVQESGQEVGSPATLLVAKALELLSQGGQAPLQAETEECWCQTVTLVNACVAKNPLGLTTTAKEVT